MHAARTTTGQGLTISYDAATNAVMFHESDWFADAVRSSAVPARSPARPLSGVPPRPLVRLVPRRPVTERAN